VQQKILPSKKIKDKGNNNTDKNASRQGEIESEAFALDRDVAGQMPQPRQFAGERKYHTDDHQQDSDIDQSFAEAAHVRSLQSF
jgi:hypothetical protein